MICGGEDESDEFESLSTKRYDQFPEDRGPALMGMGGVGAGALMDQPTEGRGGSFEGTGGFDVGAGSEQRWIRGQF